ncbi:hypothetical protein ACBI99_44845 [Nonomuraea sp. ATR24]|uniref:hypothetical protein n=1 Tax=Nonomuraea sp. ATR24 TaxID=1676744 RepID=UPI0035BF407A
MIPNRNDLEPCPADCGAAVLWTVTEHGRRMAVDAEPHELGNQAVYRTGPGTWRSRSLDGADARPPDPWEHRYRPHIATCPRRHIQQAIPGLPRSGGSPPRTRRRPARRRYPRKIT